MFTKMFATLKKITPYIFSRENVLNIALGKILTFTRIALNLVTPYVFSKAIIAIAANQNGTLLGFELTPLAITGVYVAVWPASSLATSLCNWVWASIGPNATAKLVLRYFKSLLNQSLRFHTEKRLGVAASRILNCYIAVPDVSTQLFTQIVPTTIEMIIVLSILASWYGWEVSLGLGGIFSVYTIYNIYAKDIIVRLREAWVHAWHQSQGQQTEVIRNYVTIHIFNNVNYETERLDTTLTQAARIQTRSMRAIHCVGLGQVVIAGLGFSGLCLLVAHGALTQQYTAGDFVIVSAYLAQFSAPLTAFGSAVNALLASLTQLEDVFTEIEQVPEIIDAHPGTLLALEPSQASIEFRNVNFHYMDGVPILKNVSFIANSGEKTGIVGTTGAGKSTIANLLFRFFDPCEGEIRIGGRNIKEVGLESLRAKIRIVPQKPIVFNDTVNTNVAYGGMSNPEGVSRAEVQAAVSAASLHLALDSKVGEAGAQLSGGELQRLAIARAILKSSAVIDIYDEATSGLDSKVEEEVQRNIDSASSHRTSIVITHRLKNLINADKIIVLHEGEVVEVGTHQQLISLEGGIYARLWHIQQQGYSDDEELAISTPIVGHRTGELLARSSRFAFAPSSLPAVQQSASSNNEVRLSVRMD